MRASSLPFVGTFLAWLLSSCSPRTSAEIPQDASLEGSLASFSTLDHQPDSSTIDSTFTIMEDLTGDGEPDSLELRIFGPRMEDPFSWTVRIWIQSELAFEHEAVDSYWDQFFGEPGFAGTSGSREQDKAAYYFEYLPSHLFHIAQRRAGSAIFDKNSPAGVYQVLPKEFHDRGLVNGETVQGIIEQVVEKLQAGTVVIMIPKSPGLSEFPRIYIEELGEFVPFVKW